MQMRLFNWFNSCANNCIRPAEECNKLENGAAACCLSTAAMCTCGVAGCIGACIANGFRTDAPTHQRMDDDNEVTSGINSSPPPLR